MTQGVAAPPIAYVFERPELLQRALTHRSFGSDHNERLEFIGDGALNCAMALELHRLFPELSEGDLSRLRANLVNQRILAEIAVELGLGGLLLLGEGEAKSGGGQRPSILADALEALLGAVLLDGGFDAAHRVVAELFAGRLRQIDPLAVGKDPKTLLQEFLQGHRLALPRYTVVEVRGEAHDQEFWVECSVPDRALRCVGRGKSRRAAEQDAARQAYRAMSHSP